MIELEIEELIQALQDDDEDVRWDAVSALGKIGEKAVPVLTQALQDDDEDVCYHVAVVLGEIGERAVPALIQALQDEDVRYHAAFALRGSGGGSTCSDPSITG